MTPATTNRLLVLDAETPWILSLVQALPAGWSADRLGARTAGLSPRAWLTRRPGFAAVPGWTRAYTASTMLFARRVGQHLRRAGRPRAVVHTMPWTAGLLRRFRDVPHVYRPHDFFGMYDWAQRRVEALERELCAGCRLVVPISTTHAEDLRRLGPAPVVTLPNGVASEFVRRLREPPGPAPADWRESGLPVVGCVGQITSAYDLDLISALADAVPDADFVYIGPAFDAAPGWAERVRAAFDRPNIRWLGPKPHAELPDYLARFDVCFVPYKMDDWNDRRSPLRLYDYLATGKPVLSTDVAAARELAPHVAFGRDAAELAARVRGLLGGPPTDEASRRSFVDGQTWEVRGRALADLVHEYC